jgi:hypothetical protein
VDNNGGQREPLLWDWSGVAMDATLQNVKRKPGVLETIARPALPFEDGHSMRSQGFYNARPVKGFYNNKAIIVISNLLTKMV